MGNRLTQSMMGGDKREFGSIDNKELKYEQWRAKKRLVAGNVTIGRRKERVSSMAVKVSRSSFWWGVTIESRDIVGRDEGELEAGNVGGIDNYEAGASTARQRKLSKSRSHSI